MKPLARLESPGDQATNQRRNDAAVVVGWVGRSDSRVPVETIFDQQPGDLFVVRDAGGVLSPNQLGAVRYD